MDKTQNYGSAFYSCTVGMALGALFLGLVRPAKRWSPCSKPSDNREDEAQQPRTEPEEGTLRENMIVVDLVLDQREGAERNGKTEAGCV